MRTALIALALLASMPARADTWIVASLGSYHLERRGQNEKNLGLGAERTFGENWRVVAGAYENSSSDTSVYAGAVYAPWRLGPARVGVLAAALSGYEDKPAALIAPSALIEGRRFGLNAGFIPAAGGVFFLQLKVRWE